MDQTLHKRAHTVVGPLLCIAVLGALGVVIAAGQDPNDLLGRRLDGLAGHVHPGDLLLLEVLLDLLRLMEHGVDVGVRLEAIIALAGGLAHCPERNNFDCYCTNATRCLDKSGDVSTLLYCVIFLPRNDDVAANGNLKGHP